MENRNHIKSARQTLGMTQEEFARAVGVTRPTINAMERGRRKPQPGVIEKVERLIRDHKLPTAPCTPEESELLYRFRDLSSDSQAQLLGIIRTMGAAKAGN
jgi:DNA-binding XRE family transcriptional regulator